jgi:O-methyltransferase involved in polyketide biosynthesis
VYYLPPLAFRSLLQSISDAAVVGSRVFFDFINLSTMAGEFTFLGACLQQELHRDCEKSDPRWSSSPLLVTVARRSAPTSPYCVC